MPRDPKEVGGVPLWLAAGNGQTLSSKEVMKCAPRIYLRISTAEQTTDNQERELRAAGRPHGARCGRGLPRSRRASGALKGRDKCPGFDNLHSDATCRRFDLVMAWSVDRLGRSLQDLVAFLEHLRETRCELFLHQQGSTPPRRSGRAMFGMLSVFAEFERSIIRERVLVGDGEGEGEGHEEREGNRAARDSSPHT